MLLELAIFFPIGILTNSWLPLPFEPVLLAFSAGQAPETAWVFAALGSLCAMVGETIDIKLLKTLRAKPPSGGFTRWLANTPEALLPRGRISRGHPLFRSPWSAVAAYWRRPRPWLYGLSVGLGTAAPLPGHLVGGADHRRPPGNSLSPLVAFRYHLGQP